MEESELIYMVALNRILRFNGKAALKMISLSGSAERLFNMEREELISLAGKDYGFFDLIINQKEVESAVKEVEWCRSQGISILCSTDVNGEYPESLRECLDHPILIYKKGEASLKNKKMLSVVGTRRATDYGRSICRKIISDLSNITDCLCIVSGLAFGIDAQAHRQALECGVDTIGVLAGGLDKVYPASHAYMAKEICSKGALISEFPRESECNKFNFIQRNRIIAGISQGTLIVESNLKGGSMITASLASSYGRELIAVPGRVSDKLSGGCNMLISRNMASIYTNSQDLAHLLGWGCKAPEKRHSVKSLFHPQDFAKEKILVALESDSSLEIDRVADLTGICVKDLAPALLELELEGRVAVVAGKRYMLL